MPAFVANELAAGVEPPSPPPGPAPPWMASRPAGLRAFTSTIASASLELDRRAEAKPCPELTAAADPSLGDGHQTGINLRTTQGFSGVLGGLKHRCH